ncbi:MAG: DUF3575 domain-containing protein [Bacteroidota bacterium]
MKHLIIVASLLIVQGLAISQVFAQESYYIIKTDPIAPFFKTGALAFELVVGTNWSLQLKGGFTAKRTELWDSFEGDIKGFHVTPEFRYYLSMGRKNVPPAPFGTYLALWGRIMQFQGGLSGYIGQDLIEKDFLTFESRGVGLSVGHQFLIRVGGKKIATLDLFAGGGFEQETIDANIFSNEQVISTKGTKINPRLGVLLGIPL